MDRDGPNIIRETNHASMIRQEQGELVTKYFKRFFQKYHRQYDKMTLMKHFVSNLLPGIKQSTQLAMKEDKIGDI